MNHDTLADVFSALKNAENVGKRICNVPASSIVKNVLEVLKNNNYIEKYEEISENNKRLFSVNLTGSINNCNIIKPRFPVKVKEFNKWEKRYLPASGFGIIVLTTSKGIMSHEEAKSKNLGGALLGFVY